MQRPDEGASRSRLLGAGAALAALAVIGWSTTQLACIVPPTVPALRHTGRLAPPSPTGTFRLGATTDFEEIAGPDVGWRYRLEEHVELDVSGYAMVAFNEEYPNFAMLGRAGLGVSLIEREHGALAVLGGLGVGGMHTEYDSDFTDDGTIEHYDDGDPLLGGDLGIAGSLRYGWFEPYLGFRFSTVAMFDDGDSFTFFWLMPALGVRFLADEWVAVSIEWTNGIYFSQESDSADDCEWVTGASLGIELGPTGVQ